MESLVWKCEGARQGKELQFTREKQRAIVKNKNRCQLQKAKVMQWGNNGRNELNRNQGYILIYSKVELFQPWSFSIASWTQQWCASWCLTVSIRLALTNRLVAFTISANQNHAYQLQMLSILSKIKDPFLSKNDSIKASHSFKAKSCQLQIRSRYWFLTEIKNPLFKKLLHRG